jgi:hypothetical protein
MFEERDNIIGVWSEVGLGREDREVIVKARSSATLVKARSSLARIGNACLFDQVNLRSERGISVTRI